MKNLLYAKLCYMFSESPSTSLYVAFKENFVKYKQDRVGLDVKTRKRIVDKVFGKDGIISAETVEEFDGIRRQQLRWTCHQT